MTKDEEPVFHGIVAALLNRQQVNVPAPLIPRFAAWAAAERLGPYLYAKCATSTDLRAALRPAYVGAVAAEAARNVWLRPILQALTAEGAMPFLFKGLGTAHLIYPEPALRPLGDVDLLIEPRHLGRAAAVFRRFGFECSCGNANCPGTCASAHYHATLRHRQHGEADLHFALYRDLTPDFTRAAMRRARIARVLDSDTRVLGPTDLFVVLAVHWVTSRQEIAWGSLLDLLLLGLSFDDRDWSALNTVTDGQELGFFVCFVRDVLERLWHIQFPAQAEGPQASNGLSRAERLFLGALRTAPAFRARRPDLARLVRALSRRPGRKPWQWASSRQ